MDKVQIFLKKVVVLSIIVLAILLSGSVIPFYYTLPVLTLVFSFVCYKLTNEKPKELFNHNRSEQFFDKGGIRDLIRIPVVLFAFVQDVVVWLIWGVYNVFLLLVDVVYFLKVFVFWILSGVIWFLRLLLPFWRIVLKMFLQYLIKWPWWIYRYSYRSLLRSYNWNMLKVSFIGSIIALLIFQSFYFLQETLELPGVSLIGIIFSLLALSWSFGEVSSIRGQKLEYTPFWQVKLKMKNGMETVRGVAFLWTFLVVFFLAQAGLMLLGVIPNSGILYAGFALNINFILSIFSLLLCIVVITSTFVLPTYRIYTEFIETSYKDVFSFITYILRRSGQYLAGIIPSVFFAVIAMIPPAVVVALAVFITFQIKDAVVSWKIDNLIVEQSNAKNVLDDHRIGKQIDQLENTVRFPMNFIQHVNHKSLLTQELDVYKQQKVQKSKAFEIYQENANEVIADCESIIESENQKPVINVTRVEEADLLLRKTRSDYDKVKNKYKRESDLLSIDMEYCERQIKQAGFVFYLSGLFIAICLSLVIAFGVSYYGNFFYRSYLFRNDGTEAMWKEFIAQEKGLDRKQPLLSASINIVIIVAIAYFVWKFPILSFITF